MHRCINIWSIIIILVGLFILPACGTDSAEADTSDPDPASARRAIQNKGSDTLVNLALAWAEEYRGV